MRGGNYGEVKAWHGVGVVPLDHDPSVGYGCVFGVAPLCLFLNLIPLYEDEGGRQQLLAWIPHWY